MKKIIDTLAILVQEPNNNGNCIEDKTIKYANLNFVYSIESKKNNIFLMGKFKYM